MLLEDQCIDSSVRCLLLHLHRRLLETTWRAVRLDLTAVIQALPKETLEAQAEQRTVLAEARQLDEMLRVPDASRAAEAWGLLRRALAFHARHGTFL